MEEDEINEFVTHLLRTADPDYLMAPAEFRNTSLIPGAEAR